MDLIAEITKLYQARHWSRATFCRLAGVSYSYWYRVETGKQTPSISTVTKAVSALGLELKIVQPSNKQKNKREQT